MVGVGGFSPSWF